MTTDHTTADQPDGELDTAYKVAYTILRPHDVKMREVDNAKALIEALLRRHVLTAQIEEVERLDVTNGYQIPPFYKTNRLAVLRDEMAGLEGENNNQGEKNG